MAEPLALDPTMLAKLRQRQRVRRQHTLGNVQAFFKLGERPDYDAPWQRLQEEVAMGGALAPQMAQEEQYYFGREHDAQTNAMNQALATARAALQAEVQRMGIEAGSAQARAANQMRVLWKNMEDNQARLAELQGVSPKTGMLLEDLQRSGQLPGKSMTTMAAKGEAIKRIQKMEQVAAAAQDPTNPMPLERKKQIMLQRDETYRSFGVDPGDENAPSKLASAWGAVIKRDSEQQAAQQPVNEAYRDPRSPEVIGLLENATRDHADLSQAGADALAVFNEMGLPASEALKILAENPDTAQLAAELDVAIVENQRRKQSLETELLTDAQEVERAATRTFASSSPVLEALQNLTAVTQQVTRVGEETPEGDADPRAENFFNLVANTEGGAYDRLTRMMDAIEEHPELPPAAQLKKDIMESDKFRNYMESRGLPTGSEDFAFRLMNREARNIKRQADKASRKSVDRLRESGAILGKDAADLQAAQEVSLGAPKESTDATASRIADRARQQLP